MSDPSDPIYLIILGTIMIISGVIIMNFTRDFLIKVGYVIAIIGIIPFVLGIVFHMNN